MKRKSVLYLLAALALTVTLLIACSPQQVEVTRVVTEMEQVEVTRVVTEIQEVAGEMVEVTRIVEGTAEPKYPPGTQLRILQWSHFVPNYDKWFDQFAMAWGEANGVEVTVDHINLAELEPALAAEIDAGAGHTLVEMVIAPSSFIEGLQDLTDVNMAAQERFGEQIETCTANSYLPANDMWYGFCHAWVPDPGDYRISMWEAVGYPNGPTTWAELLDGGRQIREQFGAPLGLGLSPEIDSEMANRAIIWSFGGSVQDENENVVINSPEVIEAVNFMAQLYQETMTEEVFSWNAASNNQGLIAGELSYILNSISAYRSLQKIDPEAADDIGFTPALAGPNGLAHSSSHVWQIYVVPQHVQGPELDAAKEFMLHLVANYNQATYNSELYNFPAFRTTVPQLYEEGGWLDVDPFGSRPPDKLKVLLTAEETVTHLGYPGPANPAVAQVYAEHIIPNMMGRVARGEVTAEVAVAEAEARINEIFAEWRAKGFVGGGD